MRIVALVVAVWGLVGMPALCRAGLLVQCCAPTHHAEKESRGCPDGCPNGCDDQLPDKGPDDTDPSDKGDCSSCADVCNLVSLAPQKMAGEVFESTVTPVVPTTEALTTGLPPAPYAFPGFFNRWPYENLPFPTSDRPLLI